jgi:pyruvate/2-oxoglutarate dehydrogenase complex dihydrolipoamide dehydrogenase (E3) component
MSGPAEESTYDVIVIGVGPVGQVAALRIGRTPW